MNTQPRRTRIPARRQDGVVLIIALIVLVAMTLASVALVRSSDISTQVAGNLAYRQAATQAGDRGVEAARKFLMQSAAAVLTADAAPAYYASSVGGVKCVPAVFDPTDPNCFDWTGRPAFDKDAAGNTVSYVIHRMCATAGDPSLPTTNCVMAPTSSSGNSKAIKDATDIHCPEAGCNASSAPYYRITVRVSGPGGTGTVAYVQAVIY